MAKKIYIGTFIVKVRYLYFTGILVSLAIVGYLLYTFLFILRIVGSMKKKAAVLLLVIVVGFIGVVYLFLPLGFSNRRFELVIEQGTSLRSIASALKKNRIVTSSKVLLYWLKINGIDRKIQAGKVTFNEREGILRAAPRLLKAEPIDSIVTIIEGLTIEQTAARIAMKLSIDTTEFISLCYDTSFIRSLGIDAHSLEGYLFPETYRIRPSISAKQLLMQLVESFHGVYKQLSPDNDIVSKYSLHEIVTMASIVEKEATLDSERERIAGVFFNRLTLGYPLGADPTVRYLLKKFSGDLRVSELNIDSPYNTRRNMGLPPGPICSPGRRSLEASLAPAKTKELYFVAKWDGSGEHDFSLTNEEHNRKKLLIRKRNQALNSNKERQCAKPSPGTVAEYP